jgi:WD40 repeat protein
MYHEPIQRHVNRPMHTRARSLLAIPVLVVSLSALSAQAQSTQPPQPGQPARQAEPELVVSVGHSSRPSDVAFAGGYLATAIWSNVALVDLSTGLTVAHLPHGGHITALEASPREDVIAVGACDRSLQLWDVKSRRRLHRFAVRRECVESVSFTPDGALLALTEIGNEAGCCASDGCCSAYGSVQIWNVRGGTLVRELGKDLNIRRVVFSSDGRWLAGVDGQGKTTVFEWPSGRQIATFGGGASSGAGLSSPDGKYLAWQGFRGLEVWDVASGARISKVDEATAAEFLNDGRLAYVEDDRLKIVMLPNGPIEEQPLEQPKTEGDGDVLITMSPQWVRIHRSGRTIAGTFDARTVLWDTSAATLRDVPSPVLMDATSLQWSRSGIVAWRDSHSGVWAWSDASGQPVTLEKAERWGLADGESLFDDSGRQQEVLIALLRKDRRFDHVAFSPDGQWIATASQTDDLDAVEVWPAAAAGAVESVKLDTADVTYGPQPPAFSSDSRRVATFRKGTSLMMWSTGSWKLERKWTLPGTGRALMFAPQGSRVAIAADGEAAIWDSNTGRKLVTLTGQGASKALQIAWSPDGRRVVTSSDDGVLRFWSASNGRLIASLYALADTRDWLLLTPDGRFDGSDGALATVVAWRTGDRVSLDKRLTDRRRVRNLWRNLSARGVRR